MTPVQFEREKVHILYLICLSLSFSQNWGKPSEVDEKVTTENDEDTCSLQKARPQATIRIILIRNEIMPEFFRIPPKYEAFITYHDGSMPNMGNTLRPDQVKFEPHTVTYNYTADCLYTIVMTGLDEPSKATPTKREFLHWIVINIPGDNIMVGKQTTEYYPVMPKQKTGLHRYLFLVYEQKTKIDFKDPPLTCRNDWGRANWSSRKFSEKYKLGEPHAVNFFYSKHTNMNKTLASTTTEKDDTSVDDDGYQNFD